MEIYNIFIFRRDLRIHDNNGINYCIENLKNVIPIFIFTPEQVTENNKYKSNNAIQFMIESLKELNEELNNHGSKLHIFYGNNIEIINYIISKIKIENIIFNMDYTPYALNRDKCIETLCEKNDIEIKIIQDYLLMDIGSLNKKDQWRWRCSHQKAYSLAKLFLPYSVSKRHKLLAIINHYEFVLPKRRLREKFNF